eukprot:TRINITY_DN3436_c0_g1_i1.p1 TRINITY_DN3436_c0_g1~~TRINITY_DN3436_c0_g1_i1.p1  ORF type:complete len:560 (-),score=85.62 TRINITY_DN3436_c0_g1_i1:3732-5411(-)
MGPLAEFMKGRNAAFMYESVLYPEVRLLTYEKYQDTLGIGYRFAESPSLIMDAFNYFSRGKCFTYYSNEGTKRGPPTKNKKAAAQKKPSVLETFPTWFNPKAGATLNQWIAAFFETVLINKFALAQKVPIEEIVAPFQKLLRKGQDLTEFWKTRTSEDKLTIIKDFLAIKRKETGDPQAAKVTYEMSKLFICYTIANMDSKRFMDSLYFMRLDVSCMPVAELCKGLIGLLSEKYRLYIISCLENDGPVTPLDTNPNCLACYKTKAWDQMKTLDCYKHFFESDAFDSFYSLRLPEEDKKRKHKKKKKKQSNESPNETKEEHKDEIKAEPLIEKVEGHTKVTVSLPEKPAPKEEKKSVKEPCNNVPKKEAKVKKTKSQRKHEQEFHKNTKAEYEKLKRNAIKLFEEKTAVIKPVNSKTKKINSQVKDHIEKKSEVHYSGEAVEKESNKNILTKSFKPQKGSHKIYYRKKVSENNSPVVGPISEPPIEQEGHYIEKNSLKPMVVLEPHYCYLKESHFFSHFNKEIESFIKTRLEYVAVMQAICKELLPRIEKIAKYTFTRSF